MLLQFMLPLCIRPPCQMITSPFLPGEMVSFLSAFPMFVPSLSW